MSEPAEAIGMLATATAAAATIEPEQGERAPGHGACVNCSAPLAGAYCSNCGQRAHVHRSLFGMLEEMLHGILHLDGKVWRTLPMLVFRPGTLSRRYAHGARARYISPMAMFLFATFLMFVASSFVTLTPDIDVAMPSEQAIADARAEVRALDRQVAEAARKGESIDTIIAARNVAQRTLDVLEARRAGEDVDLGAILKAGDFTVEIGNEAWNRKFREAMRDPAFMLYKLKNTAYKFSWLLIPISIPFLWLLFFWKRGITSYDHAVFILYSLSFMSLLLIAVLVFQSLPDPWSAPSAWLLLVPPVHMFVQLRGAYALGVRQALWRTVALLLFCATTLLLFLAAVIVLGVS